MIKAIYYDYDCSHTWSEWKEESVQVLGPAGSSWYRRVWVRWCSKCHSHEERH